MNTRSVWDQEYTVEESLDVLSDLALVHCSLAGADGSALADLIKSKRWAAVVNYEFDYSLNVEACRNIRQAVAFFSKFEPLDLGLDKEKVAYDKFVKAEQSCRETNERLRTLRSANGLGLQSDIASVMFTAQRKIARALGVVPRLGDLTFKFGPGATTTVKAKEASPRIKLGAALACSTNLFPSVAILLEEAPQWVQSVYGEIGDDVVSVPITLDAGMLQFVPKNAKTYRSIVVEPVLNGFAQKGIGTYLKGRLRKVGVDLRDQTRNQQLAKEGSMSGKLATLDLSSASDTVSIETVADLLPIDWFSFLSTYRTSRVAYKDEVFVLEKFSSMGNAFTFELESLIFWGLSSACTELTCGTGDVGIFGDDIIVPIAAVPLLEKVLTHCGFSLNTEKSFAAGPFRESCGADWLLGQDIRPYYQKKLVSQERLFVLHNFYARNFEFKLVAYVQTLIHPSLLLFGPDGYGDGHLIGSYEPVRRLRHTTSGFCGVVFDTFTHRARRNMRRTRGDWALPAYSIYANASEDALAVDHYAVRGSRGYKRISIYTLRQGVFL